MNIFTCRVDLEVDRLLRRTMLDRAASPLFLSSSKGLLDPPCAARTLAQLASGGTILATDLFGRGGRAVECAGLENRKAERPREFESHPLRHFILGFRLSIFDCQFAKRQARRGFQARPRRSRPTNNVRRHRSASSQLKSELRGTAVRFANSRKQAPRKTRPKLSRVPRETRDIWSSNAGRSKLLPISPTVARDQLKFLSRAMLTPRSTTRSPSTRKCGSISCFRATRRRRRERVRGKSVPANPQIGLRCA